MIEEIKKEFEEKFLPENRHYNFEYYYDMHKKRVKLDTEDLWKWIEGKLTQIDKANQFDADVIPKIAETIDDGFGNTFPKYCECGSLYEIVRPGKIQCPNCD